MFLSGLINFNPSAPSLKKTFNTSQNQPPTRAMLRHPYVVPVLNFLYVTIGGIFFILLIALNYEQYGWLQNPSEIKLAIWIISALFLVYLSTFVDYSRRPWLLILYLIATIYLLRFPLLRRKKVVEVAPIPTKHD